MLVPAAAAAPAPEAVEGRQRRLPGKETTIINDDDDDDDENHAPEIVPAVEQVGAADVVPELAAAESPTAAAAAVAAAVTSERAAAAAAAPAMGVAVEEEAFARTSGTEFSAGGVSDASPSGLEDDGGALFAAPAAGVDEPVYSAPEEAVSLAEDTLLPAAGGGLDDVGSAAAAVAADVPSLDDEGLLLLPAGGVDDYRDDDGDGDSAAMSAAEPTPTTQAVTKGVSGSGSSAGDLLLPAASADGVVGPPGENDFAGPPEEEEEAMMVMTSDSGTTTNVSPDDAAVSGDSGRNDDLKTPALEGGWHEGLASDAGTSGGIEGRAGVETKSELETTSSPTISQSPKTGGEEEAGRDAVTIERNVHEESDKPVEPGDSAQSESVQAAVPGGVDKETAAESPEVTSSTDVLPSSGKPAVPAAAGSPAGSSTGAPTKESAEERGHGNRKNAPLPYDKIWDSSEVLRDEECATATGGFPTEEAMPSPLPVRAASTNSPAERRGGADSQAGWTPARKAGVGSGAGAPSIGAPTGGVSMPACYGSGGAEPIGASPGRGGMRYSSASSASTASQRRGGGGGAVAVAAGAGVAAAGAAGAAAGAAGQERDWLDDLIDLFVHQCSTCVADDAGQ